MPQIYNNQQIDDIASLHTFQMHNLQATQIKGNWHRKCIQYSYTISYVCASYGDNVWIEDMFTAVRQVNELLVMWLRALMIRKV